MRESRRRRRWAVPGPSASWGGAPFEGMRWHESPDVPFRFVGLARNLIRLRHTGWYMDPDGWGELARGVVYRLPHGRGYLAGIADPYQSDDDGRGPALLECGRSGYILRRDVYDTAEDAARMADELARLYAERECEYQERERRKIAAEEAAAEIEELLTEIETLPEGRAREMVEREIERLRCIVAEGEG